MNDYLKSNSSSYMVREGEEKSFLDLVGLNYLIGKLKDLFVEKETGKGLSTEDFTTEDATKLDNLKEFDVALTFSESGNLNDAITDGSVNHLVKKQLDDGTWLLLNQPNIASAEKLGSVKVAANGGITVNSFGELKLLYNYLAEIMTQTDEEMAADVNAGKFLPIKKFKKSDSSWDWYLYAEVPKASDTKLGAIKIGDGLAIDADGKVSVTATGGITEIPKATDTTLGGVLAELGSIQADWIPVHVDKDGKIWSEYPFLANQSTAGVVKGGSEITVAVDGTLELSNTIARKSDIVNVYIYKGSKATTADLPTTDNVVGDVWNVEANNMNYAWDGTGWDPLGSILEITPITNAEIDALFAS